MLKPWNKRYDNVFWINSELFLVHDIIVSDNYEEVKEYGKKLLDKYRSLFKSHGWVEVNEYELTKGKYRVKLDSFYHWDGVVTFDNKKYYGRYIYIRIYDDEFKVLKTEYYDLFSITSEYDEYNKDSHYD